MTTPGTLLAAHAGPRAVCALALVVFAAACPPTTTNGTGSADSGGQHVDAGGVAVTDAGTVPPDAGAPGDAGDASDAATADAAPGDASAPDASLAADAGNPVDGGNTVDSGTQDAGAIGADAGSRPWRTSLGSCWNEGATCRRALLLSHGGDWGGSIPYGSHPAHVKAWENGADAVKVDVRISQDNVPMVIHSSPFEIWETLNCYGRKVEEMHSADLAGCHMLPSSTETFPRLDDTINWARGRINLMLTVKQPRDFAGAMALTALLNAQDFVFLEIAMGDITAGLPTGWEQFRYDVQLASLAELDAFLALPPPPSVLMVALDLNEFTEPEADIAAAIATKVIPAGLHPLTPSAKTAPSVDNHLHRYGLGYDVLYTYGLANGVTARTQANTQRGISPP